MAPPDAETKLAMARTRLVLDKPFLGALVLRLPLQAANPSWCATTATDARRLYYNRDYIDALSTEEVQFVVAHEALHCALGHFARRGHRVKRRWDLACDFAINPLLLADGLKPPPNALVLDLFDNMSAEEIYPCLDDNADGEPMDDHLYDSEGEASGGDGGSGQPQPDTGGGAGRKDTGRDGSGTPREGTLDARPDPLSAQAREELARQWQRFLAGAAQQAKAAGRLSGGLARLVDGLLEPVLPWRTLLAHYLSQAARDDYSYQRPSRREGDFILPALKSEQVDVVVALDTSGSVTPDELAEFAAEVDALKGQLRARLTLLACDSALAADGPWIYEPWEEFRLPRRFQGGGGTDFQPVFAWLDRADRRPDLLLYFTDAEGEFPSREPAYPVVWLVKGRSPVPWGQRIQLN